MVSSNNIIRQRAGIALASIAIPLLALQPIQSTLAAAAVPASDKANLQQIKERAGELTTIIQNYDEKQIGRAVDADNARIDMLYLYMQEKNHTAVTDMLNQIVNKETFKPARVLSLIQEYMTSNPELDQNALAKAKEYFQNKVPGAAGSDSSPTSDNQDNNVFPNLKAGSYLYLGTQPGKQPVKAFSVNSLGEINWGSNTKELLSSIKDQLPQDKVSSPQGSAIQQAGTENFETYNYPMIKWQPKPIPTMPGAFIQLLTLYDGKLKYKTTLFKATYLPRSLNIVLLDQFGFKLCDVRIDQNDWTQLPGSNLYEARNDGFCSEQEYRKARDFAIR